MQNRPWILKNACCKYSQLPAYVVILRNIEPPFNHWFIQVFNLEETDTLKSGHSKTYILQIDPSANTELVEHKLTYKIDAPENDKYKHTYLVHPRFNVYCCLWSRRS